MTIQTKITKLEAQIRSKFPPETPDSLKVMALYTRMLEYQIKLDMKNKGEYPYSLDHLWPIKEEWKVTYADWKQLDKETLQERRKLSEKSFQEQMMFHQEIKETIDKVKGWKD